MTLDSTSPDTIREMQDLIEELENQHAYLMSQAEEALRRKQILEEALEIVLRKEDLREDPVFPVGIQVGEGDKGAVTRPNDLRSQKFKSQSLGNAVLSVFHEVEGLPILSLEAILNKVYVSRTEEEEKACRSTLTTTLYRLKTAGRIERVQKGVYKLVGEQKKPQVDAHLINEEGVDDEFLRVAALEKGSTNFVDTS